MKEDDALALLDRLLLTDKWGKKLIDAAARREIIACLARVPDKHMARVHAALFPPGRLEALVGVLAKHPEPPLLKLVLAGYKRWAERPNPKVRARLDKIKALAGELAKSRKQIDVAKLTFRIVKVPARPSGVRAKQLARAERELGSEALEVFAIFDAKGKHKYDAVLVARDDGAVYAAGTMRVVAHFAQGGAEGKSEALCSALEQALEAAPKKGRGAKRARKRR